MKTKSPKKSGRKHAFTAIFLALTALLCGFAGGMYYFYPESMPTPLWIRKEAGSSNINLAAPKVQVQEGLLAETELAPESYLNDITFIGDSLSAGLATYGIIPQERVFAEVGLSHTNALTKAFVYVGYPYPVTMVDAVKKTQPKVIVFMMGINGIAWLDHNEFFNSYEELVTRLHKAAPNAVMILESILPVSNGFVSQDYRYSNERIVQYNQEIEQLAKRLGFYYLNSAEAFRLSDGSANTVYQSGDGLHLNNSGYDVLLEYIRRHAYTLLPLAK